MESGREMSLKMQSFSWAGARGPARKMGQWDIPGYFLGPPAEGGMSHRKSGSLRCSDGACLYGDVRASEHKPNRALAQPDGHAPGACAPLRTCPLHAASVHHLVANSGVAQPAALTAMPAYNNVERSALSRCRVPGAGRLGGDFGRGLGSMPHPDLRTDDARRKSQSTTRHTNQQEHVPQVLDISSAHFQGLPRRERRPKNRRRGGQKFGYSRPSARRNLLYNRFWAMFSA
ncbi:hypothetical protein B0H14DRAFT_3757992 [Mycena olivaceomarginata]|nr:hypothetical protein B0H14DRAFT_3757992 [Mycena olivaceomarginata]